MHIHTGIPAPERYFKRFTKVAGKPKRYFRNTLHGFSAYC